MPIDYLQDLPADIRTRAAKVKLVVFYLYFTVS